MLSKIIVIIGIFFGFSIAANSKSPLIINGLNIKYGDQRWSWVFNLKNTSQERLKGRTCIRFYDKDNFEVDKYTLAGDYNIAPGSSDKLSERFIMYAKDADQVVSIKMYAAGYGCTDSPGEAVSNVIDIKLKK